MSEEKNTPENTEENPETNAEKHVELNPEEIQIPESVLNHEPEPDHFSNGFEDEFVDDPESEIEPEPEIELPKKEQGTKGEANQTNNTQVSFSASPALIMVVIALLLLVGAVIYNARQNYAS